jgi:hypothetical protein
MWPRASSGRRKLFELDISHAIALITHGPLKALIVAVSVSIVLWCLLGDDGWDLGLDDASDGSDGGGD